MTVATFLAALEQQARAIAEIRSFPGRAGVYGEVELPPPLRDYLDHRGIRPYSHQADAYTAFRNGEHLVLTTRTASGKTLAFLLPVLDRLWRDPAATALVLYPTKALANDQLATFDQICRKTGISASPAIYDGDTPRDRRPRIRQVSRIVLSNPHELHQVLPWHHQWSRFFSGLSCVVIDEAHRYRGVTGSHVAFLIRRLRRICARYGSDPRFIVASATLANPAEFAGNLCGVPFRTVAGDGAPQGPRRFVLYNPFSGGVRAGSFHRDAAGILVECIRHRLQTLTFTGSRKMTELVALWAREGVVRERVGEAGQVAAYRAGYLPEERREIEQRFKSGSLAGVVSTNALELGIDIGSLDGVILAGYPGTMMATWQQAGRAGRRGEESVAVLVASPNPLDQYFMRHPDLFFGSPHESAIVDLENPYIFSGQLLCAAAELPLVGSDSVYFGPRFSEFADALFAEHLVSGTPRGLVYSGSRRPHELVGFFGISRDSFRVVLDGRTLETMDRGQAFREAHQGAVLLHQGEQYLVDSMDLAHGIVRVHPSDVDYYTRPLKSVDIAVQQVRESRLAGGFTLSFGDVEVSEHYYAYRIIRNDALLGIEPLDLPLLRFSTKAVWFTPPEGLEDEVRATGADPDGGLHGTEHALIAMMPFHVLCDRWDLGGLSVPAHPATGGPAVFVYDGHEGGIGLSEKAYRIFGDLARHTFALVSECPCREGCPACIYSPRCGNDNQPLDKEGTVLILGALCRAFGEGDQASPGIPEPGGI
ncbi:MAG TPA: DEAD/DEAH box helicase [Methanoregulaceae archaeon]|nr:MAG: DEAD/DEAH box helicase [Methanolinea sp.]HON81836.1 DEAD/DEAH box helicase [Methanoregulaceae archaeon]HPD10866.1 DEAD/DEAH box helicase [Methanoregulaceae archaeon]HRT15662.1 DEAD/DEAH box helicase [Methanoregulaceae archaeon]HRU31499.1 DEAD/DEAH box helicase [Methanoregulaceae archaeon]